MGRKLAIIGGTGASGLGFIAGERNIVTPFGYPSSPLQIIKIGKREVFYLQRHGREGAIPPHRINYKANIYALKQVGVTHIISTTSVGSLKKSIKPPMVVVPHDYICLWKVPTYMNTVAHVTPVLDTDLRAILISAATTCGVPLLDHGIYVQTLGPRLETRAEIAMLSNFGDVVGMNMATEATLAAELGIKYANVSSVDNYAHGVVEEALTFEKIIENAKNNWKNVAQILKAAVEAFAEGRTK